MPDVLTDIDVINRALARIGAGDLADIEEDSDLAEQVAHVYPDTVAAAFAAYDWRFAHGSRILDKLTAPVAGWPNGWRSAFAFPVGAISGPKALLADPKNRHSLVRDFAVEGRTIYCDRDTLAGVFLLQLAVDQWPPLFRLAVTVWCSSEFCVPVTHDKDLAAALRVDAIGTPVEQGRGGLIGRAIAIDHQEGGAPQATMAAPQLTGARNDGPWHGNF